MAEVSLDVLLGRRVGDVVGEGDDGFVGLEVGDNVVGKRGVSSATGWDVGWSCLRRRCSWLGGG